MALRRKEAESRKKEDLARRQRTVGCKYKKKKNNKSVK